MPLRLTPNPRITFALVLIAAALMLAVGVGAFRMAQDALQRAASAELLAAAIETEAAINAWLLGGFVLLAFVAALALASGLAREMSRRGRALRRDAPLPDASGQETGAPAQALAARSGSPSGAALPSADAKFSIAFRASPTGVALSRISDGQYLEVNESYARMLGYDRAEIIGHTSVELDILSAQYRAGVRQQVTAQGFVRDLEMDLRAKSGEAVSVLCSMEQIDWDGEQAFLTMVFDISARKRAELALLRKNAELSALSRLGQALIRLVDTVGLLELVHDVIGPLLGNRNLYIALYDESRQSISFPVYAIAGVRVDRPARPCGNGLTEYVIRSRAPLFLPRDVAAAAQALGVEPQGRPARCYLAVPLLAGAGVLGVIGLQDYEQEAVYDPGHLAILTLIASQAAIALENTRLFAETERLARTDPLTGIANRRQLFEVGAGELSRARRFGHPLTALMLDIDHFKQVNDAHGHAIGDRVLQSVARLCKQHVRDIDIVARYGGEEFTILLVQTDVEGALVSARRLCDFVSRSAVEVDTHPLAVTISVGVAGALVESDGFESLLERADGALYAAKQAGRNRVVPA